MNTLRLPLKKKWFEMTKNLIKLEDYREITPYWCSRFLLYNGKKKSKKYWIENLFEIDGKKSDIKEIVENIELFCTFKHFDTTTLTLGYPSNSDKERIIEFENLGISIGYGKEEWGAEKDKLYFVIKHGKRVN